MIKAAMIHHMNVAIDDVDEARAFYAGILGLSEIERPNVGRPGLWFGCGANELHLSVQPGLRGGRTGLSLQPTERPERLGGHVAYTMSGSLDDIARHLEGAGIPYRRWTSRHTSARPTASSRTPPRAPTIPWCSTAWPR
jgi:catechol 2,3-dioxygenase-like lactoylglutathione lyase family enzyme